MRSKNLLYSPEQARAVLTTLAPEIYAHVRSGKRLELEIREERRSLSQNDLLHAMVDEIADVVEWAGKKRDKETWKRLLVAAWCRTRGESVEILPALDGHGVDIVPARTSALTKAELSDLVEYVEAWKSMHVAEAEE